MENQPEIQDEVKEVLNEEAPEVKKEDSEEVQGRVDKRIGKYRFKLGEKDRTIEKQNRELEELRANQPKSDLVAPIPDNFDTHAEYMAAQTKYINDSIDKGTREKSESDRKKRDQDYEDAETAKANENSAKEWAKKTAKAVSKHEDYREIQVDFVESVKELEITDILDHISDCANGTDIVYYLQKTKPDEFERIASLGFSGRARAIGKIESQLASSKSQEKQLPAPTKTIKGGSTFSEKSRKNETYAERCKRINGL